MLWTSGSWGDNEGVAGVFLYRNVYSVLNEPPYNIRYVPNMDHPSHDFFTPEDVSDQVELRRKEWAARACRHMFCSYMQFRERYKKLQGRQGEVPNLRANPEGSICTTRKVE